MRNRRVAPQRTSPDKQSLDRSRRTPEEHPQGLPESQQAAHHPAADVYRAGGHVPPVRRAARPIAGDRSRGRGSDGVGWRERPEPLPGPGYRLADAQNDGPAGGGAPHSPAGCPGVRLGHEWRRLHPVLHPGQPPKRGADPSPQPSSTFSSTRSA